MSWQKNLMAKRLKDKMSNNLIRLLCIFLLIYFILSLHLFADEAMIIVSPDKEMGVINKKVFGNNFVGYDPVTYENWTKEYYGYSDYGAGIWDSKFKKPVKEVIDLARVSGMKIIRFPGGDGTQHYDWKKTIGKTRKHFLFGIDEFLKTCEEIGAEPVITVSYFTGNKQDSADLVEYLNALNDIKYPWAQERVKNGHPEPYHVQYFEIGNEIWHGDFKKVKEVFPRDYARRYLEYYNKMKAVDPSIKIGVVLFTDEWNKEIMGIIKDKVDFGIMHIYPYPDGEEEQSINNEPEDIFKDTLGSAVLKEEHNISETLKTIKQKSNRRIPLAITEYNGGFWRDKPIPYRHCLGNALLNAELLRVFMKPENEILMANYWNFVNEYWGMISNGFEDDPGALYDSYFKRPNFYVFQLYQEHFGNVLIEAKADDGFNNSDPNRIAYLSVNASKSPDGKKVYLMVINKNMKEAITSTIDLKDFVLSDQGDVWVLNGPGIDATNEKMHDNVKVVHKKFDIKDDPFVFTFEPHSLTAIELIRR
jgi:alpha-L-arabinofuranosidase